MSFCIFFIPPLPPNCPYSPVLLLRRTLCRSVWLLWRLEADEVPPHRLSDPPVTLLAFHLTPTKTQAGADGGTSSSGVIQYHVRVRLKFPLTKTKKLHKNKHVFHFFLTLKKTQQANLHPERRGCCATPH